MGRSSTSFSAGNLAAVKHGGRSLRLRESTRKALAQTMRERVCEVMPELVADESNGYLIDLLVERLADVRQLRDYLDSHGGPISPKGQLLKCMEMLRAREHDVEKSLRDLGIGPRARADVFKAIGTAGAKALARQRALEAQKQLRAAVAADVAADERRNLGVASSGRVGGSELTAPSPHLAEATS